MASCSGDMRRALEACAGALDELLWAATVPTGNSPSADAAAAPAEAAPGAQDAAALRRLVSIGDMAAALSKAQGGALRSCNKIG